ncbi:DUF6502 family protein [Myxococcota bacterium]|nr:DUF6502 family protein [Myxococcota bacterium]
MEQSQTAQPLEPSAALMAALERLLRPLVRLLLENRVSYPVLATVLKQLFVEVAAEDFKLEDKRVTTSRLSLLTGIHRREVNRQRQEASRRPKGAPTSISMGSQIVTLWTTEPRWLDETGAPRPLARISENDDEASFEELVASTSRDIHPRSVLDEWIRLGVVQLDDEDRVHLQRAAFVPARGFEEKAFFLGRNVADHLSAASENLMSDEPSFLERSVHYDSLPAESLESLREWIRTTGEDALARVNARARSILESAAEREHGRRVNFGVFFYESEAKEDTSDREKVD